MLELYGISCRTTCIICSIYCDKKHITAATPLGQNIDNLKKALIKVEIQSEKIIANVTLNVYYTIWRFPYFTGQQSK